MLLRWPWSASHSFEPRWRQVLWKARTVLERSRMTITDVLPMLTVK